MDTLTHLTHRVMALETDEDRLAKVEKKLDQVIENQQTHQELLEEVVEKLADLELPYQTPFND